MDALLAWLESLDRPFAFLVVLPFLVAGAAFLGEFVRKRLERKHQP